MNFETRDIFGIKLEIDPAPGSSVYVLIELSLSMLEPFKNITSGKFYVRFRFNGVHMEIRPGDDKDKLAKYYLNALKESF